MDQPLAKKSLGQHFLTCDWALPAIIDAAAISPSDTVLEIGPGTGVLTRALAVRAKRVIAIEKDEALARALVQNLKSEGITNVEIREGDILLDMPTFIEPYKVVANIPYYLTARLLRLLLEEQTHKPTTVALMIQKEVAERIVSQPPHENLLAIAVQVFGTPSIVKIVPASCFSPKPKIDSAIIAISDISNNFFTRHHIKPEAFFTVLRLGFSQKRKMLTNSLSTGTDKKTISDAFAALGINPKARPEELTLDQWAQLANVLQQ